MPGLTGEQLASELLKIRPNLPIILCTGFSHTITPEKAHDLGIRGYITKPFLMRDLALACHQAMEP
jgi:DNA-binding NarL/FixJ family response regulator